MIDRCKTGEFVVVFLKSQSIHDSRIERRLEKCFLKKYFVRCKNRHVWMIKSGNPFLLDNGESDVLFEIKNYQGRKTGLVTQNFIWSELGIDRDNVAGVGIVKTCLTDASALRERIWHVWSCPSEVYDLSQFAIDGSYNDLYDGHADARKDKAEKERQEAIQAENAARTQRVEAENRKNENNDDEPPMFEW